MDAWAAKRLRTFEDAERGLCFGRLDFEQRPAPALRRPPLGARRGATPARRQLAGAGGAAVLHGDAARPARRHAAPPLPHRRPAAARHRRRVARRLDRRRRRRRRLPARGARAQPRRAHARHRRDDPGRPVPADHRASPTPPLVIQGGPGTGKTAVGLHRASWLLYTHRDTLARRGVLVVGPNRDVHGVRLARAAGARRGRRRAARRRRARRRRRAASCATRPTVARAEGRPAAGRGDRAARPSCGSCSEPEELVLRLEGSFVSVREREVRELLAAARERARRDVGRRASASG